MIAIDISGGAFFPLWIDFCERHKVAYKTVDCNSSRIISHLEGCKALLWHWQHNDNRAAVFARQLIQSVEEAGILVFPSSRSSWHYDDKVGQKYLLEAIGAPLINTEVFYEEHLALEWINTTEFPKVWKLRGGAGSQNVKLVKNKSQAIRIVKRSFGRGWLSSRGHHFGNGISHFRRDPSIRNLLAIGRGAARFIWPHSTFRNQVREKNYVYFQDFVPDNLHDIRVVVIGERAFAIKRMVRPNDFRASGSGVLQYDVSEIPIACVQLAFQYAKRLSSQSIAFDFVKFRGEYLIVEISYAFSAPAYRKCHGFWDSSLVWHPDAVEPERFMIEDVLTTLRTAGAGDE